MPARRELGELLRHRHRVRRGSAGRRPRCRRGSRARPSSCARTGPSAIRKRLRSGPEARRSEITGAIADDSASNRSMNGRSSRRKAGNFWKLRSKSTALLGRRLCGDPRLDEEVRDALAFSREARSGPCRRSRSGPRSILFWPARIFRNSSNSFSAGLAATDQLLDVLRPSGEAGAELVQEDREPLPERRALDVVDQVRVDRA